MIEETKYIINKLSEVIDDLMEIKSLNQTEPAIDDKCDEIGSKILKCASMLYTAELEEFKNAEKI